MKKRTLIAIIITFVILFVTRFFWIEPTQVRLNVGIIPSKNMTAEGYLKIGFLKSDIAKKNIVGKKVKNLKLNILTYGYYDSAEIILTNEVGSGVPLTVTSISADGDDVPLRSCKVKNLKNGVKKYNWKLNHKIFPKINIELFLIILILSYLLSYKLVDYLADFKSVQNKSRTDILFLIAFFVLLFIPMMKIDDSVISKPENRALRKWKNLINGNEINYDFGENFNYWFNDRFFGRLFLIKCTVIRDLLLNKKVELKGELGKNIYLKERKIFVEEDILPRYLMLDEEETQKTVYALKMMEEFCNNNNIKFYVIITPTNNFIYYENYYPYLTAAEFIQFNDQVANLAEKSGVRLLYLYDYLRFVRHSDFPIYYNEDNHWTDDGAYLGYLELLKFMKKDFPMLKPVNKDEIPSFYSKMARRTTLPEMYGDGNLFKPFSFCNDVIKYEVKTKYKHYKSKPDLKMTLRKEDYYLGYDYYYPKGSDTRALVVGTSMNSALLAFLPYNFKNLKFIRMNTPKKIQENERYKIMKYYKNEILNYKPDVLIYSISTSNFKFMRYLFDK